MPSAGRRSARDHVPGATAIGEVLDEELAHWSTPSMRWVWQRWIIRLPSRRGRERIARCWLAWDWPRSSAWPGRRSLSSWSFGSTRLGGSHGALSFVVGRSSG